MTKRVVVLPLFLAVTLFAQDASRITIKSHEVNNGVVIIAAQEGKTQIGLQCNKEMPNCNSPSPGSYLMVRLPKNHGMYECQNVRIYASSADPDTDPILGEYCLVEPK